MPDLNTTVNPFSWSEVSNLLFLSQPLGVGFSHGKPIPNRTKTAAEAAWHILQSFLHGLPEMDATVASRRFNLWTERQACGLPVCGYHGEGR